MVLSINLWYFYIMINRNNPRSKILKPLIFIIVALLFGGGFYATYYFTGEKPPIVSAASCNDGTADNQCVFDRTGNSQDKPWRCVSGILTENSQVCGCPDNYYAWGDGSCTLRSYIRAYTHDLRYDDAALVDTTFKATHFDQAFSHIAFKTAYKNINPQIKIGIYRNYSAFYDDEFADLVTAWCATQTPACDPQDLIIHYKQDVGTKCDYFNQCRTFKGWNESCSPNCTPAATAVNRAESRSPNSWSLDWSDVNFSNPNWVAFNNQATLSGVTSGGTIGDVILTDNGDFYPVGTDYDKTAEYFGIPLNQSHPRIQQAFDAQNNLGDYISGQVGKHIAVAPNARAMYWYFHPYFHTGYQSLNGPIEIEVWIDWNDVNNPSGGVPRAVHYTSDYLQSKDLLQESLQGKKFFLQGVSSTNTNKDKAKIFLLSHFYLLNNKNLSFAYRDSTVYKKTIDFWPTGSVQDYLYIPAIEYNVGQPLANTFGLRDVFGNNNTIEHFELTTAADPSTPNSISGGSKNYHLFARQYENALVLVKYREYGGLLGTASRTTHDLGSSYKKLNVDGTIDPNIITTITLENNEGAILVPFYPDTTPPAPVTDLNAQLR